MNTRITLLRLLLIIAFHNSYAVTVTWNGGSGFWGQANRWSTGTVPTSLDDVIITDGFVVIPNGLNAFAKTLTITNTGTCRTNSNGIINMGNQMDLTIIENHGMFFHFGEINMSNLTSTSDWGVKGIENFNLFRTFSGSEINMINVGRKSILNTDTGNFINNGHIIITDQTPVAYTIGVTNYGTFLNGQVGYIRVDAGTYGVYNSQVLDNKGKIEVNNTDGASFVNEGKTTNFLTGTINVWDHSIHNSDDFENHGLINILQDSDPFSSFEGLYNSGLFENHGRLTIDTDADSGINNTFDYYGNVPEFENHNELYLRNSAEQSILNVATFLNTTSGYVHSDNKIAGGNLTNKGIFISTSTSKHDFVLTNSGAFNDRYGKLNPSTTDNQQLIVQPIKGPLQNGVPYNDILNLLSDSNISFGDWIIDESNPLIAGSYYPNSFTPNGTGSGDDLVFLEVTIASSGLTKNLGLVVINPNPIIKYNAATTREEQNRIELSVYPNPCNNKLNLKYNGLASGLIAIYSQNGNLMFQDKKVDFDGSVISMPESMTSGNYVLRLLDNNGIITTKKIQVVR